MGRNKFQRIAKDLDNQDPSKVDKKIDMELLEARKRSEKLRERKRRRVAANT